MTKWKDIDVELKTENANVISEKFITNMVRNYGPPPNHFHKVKSKDKTKNIKLSKTIHESEFINVLLKRKTTRIFKKEKVPFEKFSSIIYYTFGAFGINRSYKEVYVLRKTSPSGGSLHPTEAYILVLNVERLDTGFYHYNVRDNSLIFIKGYSIDESKTLAYKLTAGQEYTSESGFLVFLSTRYYRNYWKYMNHTATYQVTIRDAAHLCQTFYLLGSFLDLGVFTAAINHSNVEEELSLNPYEEGVCMMVGCGIKEDDNRESSLMPNFEKV